MLKLNNILKLFLYLSSFSIANITGVVYKDLPLNGSEVGVYGERNSTYEPGISGVKVIAYDSNGTKVDETTTLDDGSYILHTLPGKYRIEFSKYPSYLKESPDEKKLNSSVRFANDGDKVNFGLYYSNEYCQPQPQVATVFQVNGKYDIPDEKEEYNNIFGVFDYNETNYNKIKFIAKKDPIGSVWGVAYNKKQNKLYTSAFFRRHSTVGKIGTGGIYEIDLKNDNKVTPFAIIPNAGEEPENRDVNGPRERSHDSKAFNIVGKIGLGDIDLSEDENFLYVVNLNDKNLYKIDIKSKEPINLGEINHPQCNGGEWRPFALKIYEGKVYVGGVCDASKSKNRDDLKAHIVAFKENLTPQEAKVVLSFDLNYTRQGIDSNGNVIVNSQQQTIKENGKTVKDPNFPLLHPWVTEYDPLELGQAKLDDSGSLVWRYKDKKSEERKKVLTVHTQPWLMDIEFDAKGEMYIGIGDRTGYQFGSNNYLPDDNDNEHYTYIVGAGDILKATKDEDGKWNIEEEVLSGKIAEFFIGDNYPKSPNHKEVSNGGVATLSGGEELFLTAFDIDDYSQGGVYRLSKSNGDRINAIKLYDGSVTSEPFFGKASGMGDVELLCDLPPTEIGNRVWLDSNGNGIQDANEKGIGGVVVKLLDENGEVIGEVKSASDGTYIFSSDSTKSDDIENGYDYNITKLLPNKSYTIKIPNISGANKQSALGDYVLTKANVDSGENSDLRDSDGQVDGVDAKIVVNPSDIKEAGDNNHTFDFGFSELVAIGNYVWIDSNNNGKVDSNESGIEGVTLELYRVGDNPTQSKPVATTKTLSDGSYIFDNLPPDSYFVYIPKSEFESGGKLEGMLSSSGQGSSEDVDDNEDENGDDNISDGVRSIDYTLTPGNEPTNEAGFSGSATSNLPDENINLTADFGFYKGASLGDYIWYDKNKDGIQDDSEYGIQDIRVHLYKDGKDTGIMTTTKKSGIYLFENLEPNHYYSIKVDLPKNYKGFTLQNRGDDESKDSDVNGFGESDKVYLKAGENYRDLDAGLVCGCEPAIDIEKYTQDNNQTLRDADRATDPDVPEFIIGQSVTWVYKVRNSGNVPLSDVKVEDSVEGVIDCPKDTLDIGEEMNCTKEGVVSSKEYENNATATASYEDSNVSDSDLSHYTAKNPVCIGDFIWEDSNANGIQDDGENGIKDAVVELYFEDGSKATDYNGTEISPQTTNDDGLYKFCNLDPNKSYYVELTLPDGYTLSPKDSGSDDSKDSDFNSENRSDIISFESDEDNLTIDGGAYKRVCIGDYVWNDKNLNGLQDSDESGIGEVNVTLIDTTTNSEINSTTTNSEGKYEFCDLEPNKEYKVVFEAPSNFKPTIKDAGDDSLDSDIDNSGEVTVTLGTEDNNTIDAGFYETACVGDLVWDDSNHNGIQDEGESGVANIRVRLLDGESGEYIEGSETTTDANGIYHICNIDPGKYIVEFEKGDFPPQYEVTKANQGDDDTKDSDVCPDCEAARTEPFELKAGEDNRTLDLGIYKVTTSVDIEKYTNGVDADSFDEAYIAEANETITWSYIVTNNGNEPLRNIVVTDNMEVNVSCPKDELDIDENMTCKATGKAEFLRYENNATVNAEGNTTGNMVSDSDLSHYIVPTYCLGDFVWNDINQNGIQDDGEVGVGGVEVELFDENNNSLGTTVTNEDGKYEFCSLVNGRYYAKFTPPEGFVVTKQNQGDDDSKDSDVDSNGISDIIEIEDANNTTLDGGVYKTKKLNYDQKIAKTGETVIVNVLKNDDKDIDPSTIKIIDPNTNEKVKKLKVEGEGIWEVLDNGTIKFTPENGFVDNPTPIEYIARDMNGNLVEPAKVVIIYKDIETIKIGDYVWYDKNLNGIQDKNEPGVIGIKVTLLDGNGNIAKDIYENKVKPIYTNTQGYYEFNNIEPNKEYIIKFDIPKTYMPTLQDRGDDDSKDSDANKDGTIMITPKSDNLTLDLGIYCECNDKSNQNDNASFNILGALFMIIMFYFLSNNLLNKED